MPWRVKRRELGGKTLFLLPFHRFSSFENRIRTKHEPSRRAEHFTTSFQLLKSVGGPAMLRSERIDVLHCSRTTKGGQKVAHHRVMKRISILIGLGRSKDDEFNINTSWSVGKSLIMEREASDACGSLLYGWRRYGTVHILMFFAWRIEHSRRRMSKCPVNYQLLVAVVVQNWGGVVWR